MSLSLSPKVVTDGLVFYYDINNSKKSWIGRPTTNTVNALTTGIGRYNNPGFSGTVVNTGQTYRGCPIYKTTFIPQDSTYISRLGSTEGFGAFHSMGIALQANTRYMASILFKSNYPLQNSASQGFSNGYSNISGWNQNGTTSARYQDEDGWTRLYTQYLNNVNGYSSRTIAFPNQYGNGTQFTVNTTATEIINLSVTVLANGSGIPDFSYFYAIVDASPIITVNGGLTGIAILDHGLDTTNYTKLSWPSNIKTSSNLPFTYYFRVSVPTTGGTNVNINISSRFNVYSTALSDLKYWKVTFDTTNLAVGTEIETFWCCPMIEQHDTVYPSTFVNGTRNNTQGLLDLVGGNTITASSLTYNNSGTFDFNGIDNYINTGVIGPYSNYTIELWCKINATTGNQQRIFSSSSGGTHCFNTTPPGNFGFHYNPLDGSPSSTGAYTGVNVDYGVWYHVLATNAASDSVSGAKIYLNGELKSSAEPAIAFNGSAYFGSDRTVSLFSNSTIAIAKIYSRALSASDVKQNFNSMRGRFGI